MEKQQDNINEKEIILKTLKQVQDKVSLFIQWQKDTLNNDNSLHDIGTKHTIKTLEWFDLVLALVAKENGIEIDYN